MPVDLEKRKRIMQRSLKLGHCICNPRQGCPCDLFREQDVCLCAGERLPDAPEEVALTRLVENSGCASKLSQNDLKIVLSALPTLSDPRVLVGTGTCDDAGVFDLGDGTALVQSVDVFTPTVDDPYTFGRIAAANSLSDLYAMGAHPLTALSIAAFPIEKLSHGVLTQMLRGGLDALQEAGVAILGGHSIKDDEIKLGFAVTGLVDPAQMVTNNRAQPGDLLVLTKPLGVGVITFAAQLGRAPEEALAAAASSMTRLNRAAAEVMVAHGVVCATDVTGFGLLGHLSEMVAQSGVTAEVWPDRVPALPGARELLAAGVSSGALERNREYAGQYVEAAPEVGETETDLLYDPQTSGGLLLCIPAARAAALLADLHAHGVPEAVLIGRIAEQSSGRIVLKHSESEAAPMPDDPLNVDLDEECCCAGAEAPADLPSCCGPEAPVEVECCCDEETPSAPNVPEQFGAFLHAVNEPGALSQREKQLLALSLSVLARCAPCVKIHLDKSRKLGLSEAEITEAVWLAVSFGGSPVLMFYKSLTE